MARVVIVDDNLFIRTLLREILLDSLHEVVGDAGDGERAMEIVRSLRPDVVILDLVMPTRNGLDTLPYLMTFDPRLIVLVCSASLSRRKVIAALHLGAKGFIPKPFSRQTVLDAVGEALNDRPVRVTAAIDEQPPSAHEGHAAPDGGEDQRDFIRVNAALPVLLETGPGLDPVRTVTVDLSGSGVLLAHGPVSLGDEVGFAIDLGPDQPPLTGRARVARVTRAGEPALAFEQISIADHERFVGYIHARHAAAVAAAAAAIG